MHYYFEPMMNSGWGFGLLMTLLWFAFFIVLAVIAIRLLRDYNGTRQSRDPLDIAKERYAKGELTKEQFEQLKKDLKS